MNILLVDDEAHVVSFIKKGLSEEGYQVSVAMDGKIGWEMYNQFSYDLLILDIMLPEMNGLDLCKEIRKQDTKVPIIFLTALGTAENVVLGLNLGADDYLVKPFKFIELKARIQTLLRRVDASNGRPGTQTPDDIYSFDDLVLNDTAKTVSRAGESIHLTTTEYRLLLYFLKNKNKVLSRMEILENVWDIDFNMGTNVVDVYVNYLRKKVDNRPNKLIHTVIGMGYVLRHN